MFGLRYTAPRERRDRRIFINGVAVTDENMHQLMQKVPKSSDENPYAIELVLDKSGSTSWAGKPFADPRAAIVAAADTVVGICRKSYRRVHLDFSTLTQTFPTNFCGAVTPHWPRPTDIGSLFEAIRIDETSPIIDAAWRAAIRVNQRAAVIERHGHGKTRKIVALITDGVGGGTKCAQDFMRQFPDIMVIGIGILILHEMHSRKPSDSELKLVGEFTEFFRSIGAAQHHIISAHTERLPDALKIAMRDI